MTSEAIMKMVRLPTAVAASEAEMVPVFARPERRAMMTMARMSSTMRMPKTSLAKGWSLRFISWRTLMMTVVEDMASMPPRNMESMVVQPKSWPTS